MGPQRCVRVNQGTRHRVPMIFSIVIQSQINGRYSTSAWLTKPLLITLWPRAKYKRRNEIGYAATSQNAVRFAQRSRRLTIRTTSQTQSAAYATAMIGRAVAMRGYYRHWDSGAKPDWSRTAIIIV